MPACFNPVVRDTDLHDVLLLGSGLGTVDAAHPVGLLACARAELAQSMNGSHHGHDGCLGWRARSQAAARRQTRTSLDTHTVAAEDSNRFGLMVSLPGGGALLLLTAALGVLRDQKLPTPHDHDAQVEAATAQADAVLFSSHRENQAQRNAAVAVLDRRYQASEMRTDIARSGKAAELAAKNRNAVRGMLAAGIVYHDLCAAREAAVTVHRTDRRAKFKLDL